MHRKLHSCPIYHTTLNFFENIRVNEVHSLNGKRVYLLFCTQYHHLGNGGARACGSERNQAAQDDGVARAEDDPQQREEQGPL